MSRTLAMRPEADQMREFLIRMIAIDRLQQWALEAVPLPVDFQVEGVSAEQLALLKEPEGTIALQEWLQAYAQSIPLLREYRNGLVHRPGDYEEDELADVSRSAKRVLKALSRRLTLPIQ